MDARGQRLNSRNLPVHDGRCVSDGLQERREPLRGFYTSRGLRTAQLLQAGCCHYRGRCSGKVLVAPVTSQRGDLQNTLSVVLPVIQSTVSRMGLRTSHTEQACQLHIVATHITCIWSRVPSLRRLQTSFAGCLFRVPQSRPTEHPLPCELRQAALKLITGLEFERLSPRAAVQMRVKKFK